MSNLEYIVGKYRKEDVEELDVFVLDNFDQYADEAALLASDWYKRNLPYGKDAYNERAGYTLVDYNGGKAVEFAYNNGGEYMLKIEFAKGTIGAEYTMIRFKVDTTAEKFKIWTYGDSGQNGTSHVISECLQADGYVYVNVKEAGGKFASENLKAFAISFAYQNGSKAIIDDIQFVGVKAE